MNTLYYLLASLNVFMSRSIIFNWISIAFSWFSFANIKIIHNFLLEHSPCLEIWFFLFVILIIYWGDMMFTLLSKGKFSTILWVFLCMSLGFILSSSMLDLWLGSNIRKTVVFHSTNWKIISSSNQKYGFIIRVGRDFFDNRTWKYNLMHTSDRGWKIMHVLYIWHKSHKFWGILFNI